MDQAYYANQRDPELQRCTYPLHIVVLTRQAAEPTQLHHYSSAELERSREREQLTDRIDSLQQMLADEKSERRQLTALLTDQREKPVQPPRKGLWARLVG